MDGENFTKIDHDAFMSLPSNRDRLDYLQKWYAYLLKKAKTCKADLECCSAGITNLAVDAANANRIVVKYQTENGAETTTGIEPQGSDDQGIRSIEEDTTTETGRSYTITYGKDSSTCTFVAKTGNSGKNGSYNDVGDKYYNSGRTQWTGRATGFSVSGKGISGSVSGVNVGATALSMTAGLCTVALGVVTNCFTGTNCKTKAAQKKLIALKTGVSGTEAVQEVNSTETIPLKNEVVLSKSDTGGVINAVAGMNNNVPVGGLEMNNGVQNNLPA